MITIRDLVRARRAKGWSRIRYQLDDWSEHVWHAPTFGELPSRVERVTWDGERLSYFPAKNPRRATVVLYPDSIAEVVAVLYGLGIYDDALQLSAALLALDGFDFAGRSQDNTWGNS